MIKYKKSTNVAVTGAQSVVYRCKEIENELSSNFTASTVDKVKIKLNKDQKLDLCGAKR